MGSGGASRAGPVHAYGPFSTHYILLHGFAALLLIHQLWKTLRWITERPLGEHKIYQEGFTVFVFISIFLCHYVVSLKQCDIVCLNLSVSLHHIDTSVIAHCCKKRSAFLLNNIKWKIFPLQLYSFVNLFFNLQVFSNLDPLEKLF